ncbi:MAG: hypothetical protein N3B10_13670 [Armatimonadetes bacterium]|nr:hypothetical protein [Armatimonadota bacterium]MCX7969518.1 hypothetical protein [Armatimonadota bacterium]MDW8143071.1 hypothetical protein [Armatimonadota bacterium]
MQRREFILTFAFLLWLTLRRLKAATTFVFATETHAIGFNPLTSSSHLCCGFQPVVADEFR